MDKNSKRENEDHVPDETFDTYPKFRRALHAKGSLFAGLRAGRAQLIPAAIPEIVRKLSETPLYRNVIVRHPFPTSIEKLKQKRALPTVSGPIEAAWTASILSLFESELNHFVDLRDLHYSAMARSDYEEASEILLKIQEDLGHSLWLISAKVALLQTQDGTTAQKRYLKDVLSSKGVSGSTGYLSYLFGFTAEENVSLADMTREWSRLETFNLSPDAIQYFRYQISAFSYSQVDKPWKCVGHEENSALVDRFETFVEMSVLSYMRSDTIEDAAYIRDAVSLLAAIPDRRIQNILALLAVTPAEHVEIEPIASISDGILQLPGSDFAEALRKQIIERPSEFSLYEVAAQYGLRTGYPFRLSEEYSLVNSTIIQLESIIGLKENYHESRFSLQKTALIHRRSPLARAIVSFLSKEDDRLISTSTTEDEGVWALASPLGDPEQLPVLKQLNDHTAPTIARKGSEVSAGYALTAAVVFPSSKSDEIVASASISDTNRQLYQGHLAFNRGDFATALACYRTCQTSAVGSAKSRSTRLIYEAAHALDDLYSALQVITDAYLQDQALHLVLPLEEIALWVRDNTGLDNTALNRAIALNMYHQHGTTKYDGDLSDAFEDVLEFYEVEKPSDLLSKLLVPDDDQKRWVHFLREIATIRRLEDGTRLMNYEEIETERLSVLNGLVASCPELSNQLADEIITLTQEREVARLAEQFDRSRIYVNEIGIKQFIEVELRNVVARYLRLRNSPDQHMVHMEEILKRILKAAGDEFSSIILPATEEEDLLYAIYGLVADAFVLNPDHGLKTYLTTRILHGSIEGELRSSFARQKTIFSANLDTEFDNIWKSRLRLDNSDYVAVRTAVLRFSRRVTDAINELKDKKIRILNKDAPNGLFDFTPGVLDVVELRDQLRGVVNPDDFADKIISLLWTKADRGLSAVRDELEGDFRRRVLQAAETLRGRLSNVKTGSDVSRLEDALTNSLTNFQLSVDRVLAWFNRSGSAAVKSFSVETAVQVAARLTNSRFPTQPITPTIVEGALLTIRGTAFSRLLDILRNCFQNAIEHAEVDGRAPTTRVACRYDGNVFHFEVANELPPEENPKAVLKMAEAARRGDRGLATPALGRGTGLREIDRILLQEGPLGAKLVVGVSEQHLFEVSFDIKG